MPRDLEQYELLAHAEPDVERCLLAMLQDLGSTSEETKAESWLDQLTVRVERTLGKCGLLKKCRAAREDLAKDSTFHYVPAPDSTAALLADHRKGSSDEELPAEDEPQEDHDDENSE